MAGRKLAQNWDDLRHFLAVARSGTLSAAADILGTDHTTVARRVQRLEEALETKVFYRSSLGYSLTLAGEKLQPIAEAMEAGYIAAAAARGANPTISGIVRIGAPDGFGTWFLAPRIHKLAQAHPKLEIELVVTARAFSLSKREADLLISLTSPEHIRVVSRRLTDYRLMVYASRGYLAAHPDIGGPGGFNKHDFIGYIEDMLFTPELNYLAAIGTGINARIRSTNLIAQVNATLAGGGLCVLPAFIAQSYPDLVPVMADKSSLKRSYYLHIHEDNSKAAHIRAAAAFIATEVTEAQQMFEGGGTV
jgi:DNA-binding transcriptional LysR family regulator